MLREHSSTDLFKTIQNAESKKFSVTNQDLWIPIILTSIVCTALFWNLGARSLADWDEAIYAQISKEIFHSNQWLTLHWGYKPWFHKPPLFMWLTTLAYYIFGVGEVGARAISAIAGTGLALLTYLLGKTLFDRAAGILAEVILSLSYVFVFFSRFGTTDIALTFLIYVSIFLYSQAIKGKTNAWYGGWGAIGVSFLIKGFAAAVTPLVLAIALLVHRQFGPTLKKSEFWLGIALAALIVLPWHIAMLQLHGAAFINEYFLYHVVERATNSLEGNQGGVFFYLWQIRAQFFPWFLLLPVAFWMQAQKLTKDTTAIAWPLIILVAVVLGGYTFASTKLPWYIIPVYPALAIWIGGLGSQVLQRPRSIAFWGLAVAAIATAAIFPTKIVFLTPSMKSYLSIGLSIGTILLVLGHIWQRSFNRMIAIALCLLLATAGLREIRGLYRGNFRSEAKLAATASQSYDSNNAPILVLKLAESIYVPTILFYSNRPVQWITQPEGLTKLQLKDEQDFISAQEDSNKLSEHYDVTILEESGKLVYGTISPSTK